jgi:hypothetical protein
MIDDDQALKFLIIDKDTCLVKPKSGTAIMQPDDQEDIPGAAELVRDYANAGWTPIAFSDQGRKKCKLAEMESRYCMGLIPELKMAAFSATLPRFSDEPMCFMLNRRHKGPPQLFTSAISGFFGGKATGHEYLVVGKVHQRQAGQKFRFKTSEKWLAECQKWVKP